MLSVSLIVVEEFCPTLLYNVASVYSGLQNLFMLSYLKVPSQHFHQVEVWTLTGPSQHLVSFPFQTLRYRCAAVLLITFLLQDPISAKL